MCEDVEKIFTQPRRNIKKKGIAFWEALKIDESPTYLKY